MWAVTRLLHPTNRPLRLANISVEAVPQAMAAVAILQMGKVPVSGCLQLGLNTRAWQTGPENLTAKPAGTTEVSWKPYLLRLNASMFAKSSPNSRGAFMASITRGELNGFRAYSPGASGDFGSADPGGTAEKLAKTQWSQENANHVSFIGRAGKDAVISYTEKATVVTTFPLAVDNRPSAEPMWFTVEVRGVNSAAEIQMAEAAAEIKKGQQVCVQGKLSQWSGTRKDGSQGSRFTVYATLVCSVDSQYKGTPAALGVPATPIVGSAPKQQAAPSSSLPTAEPPPVAPVPSARPLAPTPPSPTPPALTPLPPTPIAGVPQAGGSSRPRLSGAAPAPPTPGLVYELGRYTLETWKVLPTDDKWHIFISTRDEWDDCRLSPQKAKNPKFPDFKTRGYPGLGLWIGKYTPDWVQEFLKKEDDLVANSVGRNDRPETRSGSVQPAPGGQKQWRDNPKPF